MAEPLTVVVGRITRAHGLRGELAVEVRTDEPERRFAVGSVLSCEGRPVTVAGSRRHQGKWLVRFEQVPDRTAAEQWHGRVLEATIDVDEAPQDDGAFYDHQLVGLEARSAVGETVGSITAVQHLPAQDLLVLDVDGTQVFVPFVEALVPTVDLGGGFVVVADVPGLLDPDAAESANPESANSESPAAGDA